MKRIMEEAAAPNVEAIHYSVLAEIWVGGDKGTASGSNTGFWTLVLEDLSGVRLQKEEVEDRKSDRPTEALGGMNPRQQGGTLIKGGAKDNKEGIPRFYRGPGKEEKNLDRARAREAYVSNIPRASIYHMIYISLSKEMPFSLFLCVLLFPNLLLWTKQRY